MKKNYTHQLIQKPFEFVVNPHDGKVITVNEGTNTTVLLEEEETGTGFASGTMRLGCFDWEVKVYFYLQAFWESVTPRAVA